jgi:hypothetical protein
MIRPAYEYAIRGHHRIGTDLRLPSCPMALEVKSEVLK